MKLTKEQAKHTSRLAKLDLSDVEIEKFGQQLSSVLEYVELLNEADTIGVEPTAQTTGLKNVYQKDEPQKESCLTQQEVLKNAPEKEAGHVKTKTVF